MTNTGRGRIREKITVDVRGHALIRDDLGNVLLDEENAVHPENMARVFGRALAHEDNYYIYKMAFGNGGTIVTSNFQITYKTPNDGQPPDPNTWKSQLYNEVYWEVVDDQSALLGHGPGAVPADDPPSVPNVSGPGVRSTEQGLVTKVLVECVLNSAEPTGEFSTDIVGPPNVLVSQGTFVFDEIGLFTSGLPQTATAGYQDVDVGTRDAAADSGLAPSTGYNFTIAVDGAAPALVNITTPAAGSGPLGVITYGDLVTLLNAVLVGCTASIDGAPTSSTNTFGFLKFTSNTTGALSAIAITVPLIIPVGWLFNALNSFVYPTGILTPVPGQIAGLQNAPTTPALEAERLLTHLIFSPVLKAANRTLTILYTLTISVARSSF